MFRILAFLFVLVSSSASALVPFVGCNDVDGQQVFFEPTTTHILFANDTGLAMATTRRNVPVVAFDAQYIPQLHLVTRQFISWHECAHHQLGHVRDRLKLIEEFDDLGWIELDSDCYSVSKLEEQNITVRQLRDILTADLPIIREATKTSYPRKTKHISHTQTFEQRIVHMQYCR